MARRRPHTPTFSHDLVGHAKQISRLRRIEGQVRGLQKMIHEGRYCLEIVNQAGAVVSSIGRVQGDMLRDHLAASSKLAIAGKLPEAECRQLADKIAKMIKGLV